MSSLIISRQPFTQLNLYLFTYVYPIPCVSHLIVLKPVILPKKWTRRIHTFPGNQPAASSSLLLLTPLILQHFAQILCAPQIKWQHSSSISADCGQIQSDKTDQFFKTWLARTQKQLHYWRHHRRHQWHDEDEQHDDEDDGYQTAATIKQLELSVCECHLPAPQPHPPLCSTLNRGYCAQHSNYYSW